MIYVGQTTNMKRRYKEYKYGSKNLNAHKQFKFLQKMNSVGFDNFTFDILEIVNTKDDLNIREIYWIDTLKARDPAQSDIIRRRVESVGHYYKNQKIKCRCRQGVQAHFRRTRASINSGNPR